MLVLWQRPRCRVGLIFWGETCCCAAGGCSLGCAEATWASAQIELGSVLPSLHLSVLTVLVLVLELLLIVISCDNKSQESDARYVSLVITLVIRCADRWGRIRGCTVHTHTH